jgi:hypothetical protein
VFICPARSTVSLDFMSRSSRVGINAICSPKLPSLKNGPGLHPPGSPLQNLTPPEALFTNFASLKVVKSTFEHATPRLRHLPPARHSSALRPSPSRVSTCPLSRSATGETPCAIQIHIHANRDSAPSYLGRHLFNSSRGQCRLPRQRVGSRTYKAMRR